MKKMKKEERESRIIARGEWSNHSHVITGEKVRVYKKGEETFIEVGEDSDAALKHLLEKDWMTGNEKWTGEHTDISLAKLPKQVRHGDVMLDLVDEKKGIYKYVQQQEFDPYSSLIRDVRD